MQVPLLRQVLLQAVAAAGTHTYAYRRETLQVHHLQQGFCRQIELAGSHTNTLEYQTSYVRSLRQGLRPKVLPLQARGVILHACPSSIVHGEVRSNRTADDIVVGETECSITIVLEQTADDAVRHYGVAHQRHSSSIRTRPRPEGLIVVGILRDHQAHQDDGRGDTVEAILQRESALSERFERAESRFGDEGFGIRIQDGHQNVGDISQSGASASAFRKRRQEFLDYVRLSRSDEILGLLETGRDDFKPGYRLKIDRHLQLGRINLVLKRFRFDFMLTFVRNSTTRNFLEFELD